MELDLLNLLLVLLAAWLAGSLTARAGYPSVFGELMAGVVLGPPLLGLLHGSEVLSLLAELGVLLMMLYIGMEIDPAEMFEASWGGILATVGGFIVPFALAYGVVLYFGGSTLAGIFAGLTAATTSLAVNSRILLDLDLLGTRVGHVMMAGTLVVEALVLIIFAAVVGVAEAGQFNLPDLLLMVGKIILFFSGTVAIGLVVFPYVGRRLSEAGLDDRTFHFTLVLLIAVLFGELAEIAALHSILGAFIAGLFLRDQVLGKSLAEDLMEAVRHASIGFLAPIFFVTAGFAVSFEVLETHAWLLIGVIGAALIGKTLGTMLFYLPGGGGWREGLTIGAGMNGRGGVDLIVAGIALESGLISSDIFSVLVFTALVATAGVPFLLKKTTAWLKARGELVYATSDRRGILIVGAGAVARELAAVLKKSQPVWMISSDRERSQVASENGYTVYYGNVLQEQLLSEAHAGEASALVATKPAAEVNALAAQVSQDVFGIPKVYLLPTTTGIGGNMTLNHLNALHLFRDQIDLEKWNLWISQGSVERFTYTVATRMPAPDLFEHLPSGSDYLPLAYRSGENYLPFHQEAVLQPGDEVTLLCRLQEQNV